MQECLLSFRGFQHQCWEQHLQRPVHQLVCRTSDSVPSKALTASMRVRTHGDTLDGGGDRRRAKPVAHGRKHRRQQAFPAQDAEDACP